jgi:hypothetical protein
VETRVELRDWLAENDTAVPVEERAEEILTECGADAKVEARAWLVGRPRFALHVAPRGKQWLELIGFWFAAGNASGARRGPGQLASERHSAPYTVTPLGRETIELASRSSAR